MNLKTARLKKCLSQQELAQMIGRTVVQVSHYETGSSLPRPEIRRKIQDILGPIDWPDTGQPLTNSEQQRMFSAIQICSERIGYEDTMSLFANKGPDEIRKLTRAIIGDVEPLIPPEYLPGENKKGR